MESVLLTTSDGTELAGDLALPTGDVHGGVVLCHPHPQYGGDRFHPVVDAMFRRLPDAGLAALRFDFRARFGSGVAERLDVAAAVDELARRCRPPLHLAGYSFGAAVALAAADGRIGRIVAVAPPLGVMAVDDPGRPVLVLAPRHDQFTPVDDAERAVASWSAGQVEVIEGADHFLVGRAAAVADRAASWLTQPL